MSALFKITPGHSSTLATQELLDCLISSAKNNVVRPTVTIIVSVSHFVTVVFSASRNSLIDEQNLMAKGSGEAFTRMPGCNSKADMVTEYMNEKSGELKKRKDYLRNIPIRRLVRMHS